MQPCGRWGLASSWLRANMNLSIPTVAISYGIAKNNMDDVTCMTCLIRRADGLPAPGTYVDSSGVVHATVRWLHQAVLACSLVHDDYNGHREWYVSDDSVRV